MKKFTKHVKTVVASLLIASLVQITYVHAQEPTATQTTEPNVTTQGIAATSAYLENEPFDFKVSGRVLAIDDRVKVVFKPQEDGLKNVVVTFPATLEKVGSTYTAAVTGFMELDTLSEPEALKEIVTESANQPTAEPTSTTEEQPGVEPTPTTEEQPAVEGEVIPTEPIPLGEPRVTGYQLAIDDEDNTVGSILEINFKAIGVAQGNFVITAERANGEIVSKTVALEVYTTVDLTTGDVNAIKNLIETQTVKSELVIVITNDITLPSAIYFKKTGVLDKLTFLPMGDITITSAANSDSSYGKNYHFYPAGSYIPNMNKRDFTINLNGITLKGGSTAMPSGGFYHNDIGNLTIKNTKLVDISAGNSTGAITVLKNKLTLDNVEVMRTVGNITGGVNASEADVELINCEIHDNDYGVLMPKPSDTSKAYNLKIEKSNISFNKQYGVYTTNINVDINESQINSNKGRGIIFDSTRNTTDTDKLTVKYSEIRYNQYVGMAINTYKADLIKNAITLNYRGGIVFKGSILNVDGGEIGYNYFDTSVTTNYAPINIFDKNTDKVGGGIWFIKDGTNNGESILKGVSIHDNSSPTYGGAIYIKDEYKDQLTIEVDVVFKDNIAESGYVLWDQDRTATTGYSGVYNNHVKTTKFSSDDSQTPFDNGYNNYDINFNQNIYEWKTKVKYVDKNDTNRVLNEIQEVKRIDGNLTSIDYYLRDKLDLIFLDGKEWRPITDEIAPNVHGTGYEAYVVINNKDATITIPCEEVINYYTVSFDSGGGSSVSDIILPNGSLLPNDERIKTTRSGYNFDGWYKYDNTKWDFVNDKISDADVTLHAVWSQYIVKFNMNGLDVTVGNQLKATDEKVTEPSFSKDTNTYLFEKFNYNGVEWKFGTDVVKDNMELEAVWLPKYEVTFDTDGGTPANIDKQYVVKNKTVADVEKPVKNGAPLKEWQLNGSKWDFGTSVTGNLNLKAVYSDKFVIAFHSNGGTVVANQEKLLDETVDRPTTPTKEGNTFDKWVLADGSEYNFGSAVKGNLDLYAQWIPQKLTVTFELNGGTGNAPVQTVDYGMLATAPNGITRANFTLLGWKIGANYYNFSSPVKTNLVLVADWKEDSKEVEKPVPPVPPVVEPVVPPVVTPIEPSQPAETPLVQMANQLNPLGVGVAVAQNGINYKVVQNPDNPEEYFIYDEDGTPLGSVIVPEGKSIEDIDIESELTPLGAMKKENPKTGQADYSLFFGTTILSLIVLVLVQRKIKED